MHTYNLLYVQRIQTYSVVFFDKWDPLPQPTLQLC